jgi:hypothetical protein
MLGIPDFDQYIKQCPSVVTFEPGTLNLEPISLGIYYFFVLLSFRAFVVYLSLCVSQGG